ncbi:thiamine diphosphokinase [Lacrimispora sp. NSJ-141]|uniref:Thiamine diphosphokinase n=1 Tax=Lientehia hominis TaxID=2897778 RepID=A0AAP2W9V9_9FIRM|nr:thiamine diphosphokinase [Lientehia hominis]MCD2492372.1 thiamine diphosphokinase [Lientehia hominis]
MKILIVTGGDVDTASAAGFLKTYDSSYVIAVDGGLASADLLGLTPDLIIGDFDTVDGDLLETYKKAGIRLETHRPEKDATDTELAFSYALDLPGAEEIVILGALGRRFDHALGNLHVLIQGLRRQIPCRIIDSHNSVCLLDRGRTFRREELRGTYISFIPMTEQVTGVTLTGFKYPLKNAVLLQGSSLGISNELSAEAGTLSFETGILICVEAKD